MSRYYDWERTFSYNADVTMVIAPRDRGKTYGLRLACVRDCVRNGWTFVEIVRYKNELSEVVATYFDKLGDVDEFADIEFKSEGRRGYWRRRAEDDDDRAGGWTPLCYFVALSEAQNAKKRTYARVRRIIFDEALIMRGTHQRYLPYEWTTLANVIDTVTRESGHGDGVRPHAYLLANACDLVNPYFAAWGIDTVPPFGYSWHAGKLVLVHYEDPVAVVVNRADTTLAGRMAAGTDEGRTALSNEFVTGATDDIARRPSSARYWLALAYRGDVYAVWIDWADGYYYIDRRPPKDAEGRTFYSLTRADNTANRLVARRATPAMRALVEAHYYRDVRYDTIATREGFLDALATFGIR